MADMAPEESKEIRVIRYWPLTSPAPAVNVAQTIDYARHMWRADDQAGLQPGRVQVIASRGEIRVQYERDFDPKADT